MPCTVFGFYNPNPAPGTRTYRVEEDLQQILQLDVETFYQYSNIMLDQIAENVRFFFGFPRANKTNMNPHGYWTHLTLLDNLAKAAAAIGLVGDVAGLLSQAEEFRKLRAYRNKSITHWDASDSHLATTWDGTDLTIQRGFVGDRAELERRTAAGEFEFQMTVPLPGLYDLWTPTRQLCRNSWSRTPLSLWATDPSSSKVAVSRGSRRHA